MLTQETEYLREAVRRCPGTAICSAAAIACRPCSRAIKQVAATDTTVLISGRDRHGQGTGRALDPPRQPPRRQAAGAGQLRGDPGQPDRERVLRPRTGAFTGAVAAPRGPLRAGRRRHASFSTKSANCRSSSRRSCCACCRRASSSRSAAAPRPSRWTCASSRPPIAISSRWSPRGSSARICYFRLQRVSDPPSRRCASAAAISNCSPRPSPGASRGGSAKRIEPARSTTMCRLLRGYDWPGNVRELQNVIERAIILSSGHRLELERAMGGVTSAIVDRVSPCDFGGCRACSPPAKC